MTWSNGRNTVTNLSPVSFRWATTSFLPLVDVVIGDAVCEVVGGNDEKLQLSEESERSCGIAVGVVVSGLGQRK